MTMKEDQVLLRVEHLTVQRLHVWLERGWVTPLHREEGDEYSEIDVARIDLIRQLRDEMALDPDTVPVVLSMLDQVFSLRREMRCLLRAIDKQPGPVRSNIARELEKLRSD